MTATKIIFIRHGETEENTTGVVAGVGPGTLTAKGRLQAEALAEILMTEHVCAVYSSDLNRARQTAEIASSLAGLDEICADERLREEDASGKTKDYIRRLITPGTLPPGLKSRIMEFIIDVEKERPGETVAAFTHFGPMFAILVLYSRIAPREAARRLVNGAAIYYQNGAIS